MASAGLGRRGVCTGCGLGFGFGFGLGFGLGLGLGLGCLFTTWCFLRFLRRFFRFVEITMAISCPWGVTGVR